MYWTERSGDDALEWGDEANDATDGGGDENDDGLKP